MTKRDSFEMDLKSLTGDVDTKVASMLQLLNGDAPNRDSTGKNKVVAKLDSDDAIPRAPALAKTSETGPRDRQSSKSLQLPAKTLSTGMVNVTTRLHYETNERLTETALRQRLKKITPNTRQDIIEAALVEWFSKNGYHS